MNLRLLRLFLSVAENRSFSRAADELLISQPAVSKGVREFEAQIGATLFERGSRSIRLTEVGRRLSWHARTLFTAERAAEEELAALRGLQGGMLRVGASTTVATYFLPRYLSRFYTLHPRVELRVTSLNTHAIVEMLNNRDLDVALVEGPVEQDGLISQPWLEDSLVLIAAPSHPLASRPSIKPAEMEQELFILREHGSGTREVVAQALAAAGIKLTRTMEIGGGETIAHVVAAGVGVAIVSYAIAANQVELGKLKVIDVEGLRVARTLKRLTLADRGMGPAAVAFNRLLDAGAAEFENEIRGDGNTSAA